MILFLKEFYQNKTVRNYILIIFLIIFVILSSILAKDYFFKIINDNYDGSYLVIKSINKPKIEDKNVNEINRCIIEENNLIIEDRNILDDNIHEEYQKKSINNTLELNISKVSQNKFKTYNYENGYYVNINNWMNINETIEYLTDNGYEMEYNIKKTVDLPIENYYQYLDAIIILIIIIGFIIFIVSIINIIIDEKNKHYLYKCLGYTNKDMLSIQLSKIFSLLIIIIIINEIVQILIKYLLNITSNTNYYIYIILIVLTIMLILLDRTVIKIKK